MCAGAHVPCRLKKIITFNAFSTVNCRPAHPCAAGSSGHSHTALCELTSSAVWTLHRRRWIMTRAHKIKIVSYATF